MEKITKTFEEVVDFSNEAARLLANGDLNEKLKYALTKLVGDPNSVKKGNLANIFKDTQKESIKLQIEFASTDDRGNLLTDTKGYVYTKDNKIGLNTALDNLAVKEFEITPFYVEDINLTTLTEEQKELFKGFVIN